MSTISEKVLQKIKQGQIKPLPRWQYLLSLGGRWFGFGLLLLLAVCSLGLLWYFWSDGPWFVSGHFGFGRIFGGMPLLLLGLIIVGAVLALVDFRATGRGYRYSWLKIGLSLTVVVLLVGFLVNYWGLSQRLDSAFSASPAYQNRSMYMIQVWQNPDNGLLAGKIVAIQDNNNFSLRDFDGKIWSIETSGTIWRHGLAPEVGLQIKIIGSAKGDSFIAQEVRPWMGPGNCGMMQEESVRGCGMMQQ